MVHRLALTRHVRAVLSAADEQLYDVYHHEHTEMPETVEKTPLSTVSREVLYDGSGALPGDKILSLLPQIDGRHIVPYTKVPEVRSTRKLSQCPDS